MSKFELYQVDAFTNEPFKGNPAGVCILNSPMSAELMQSIALEMNLSETAFLEKIKEGYSIRFFTPATEVKLCGHASLSSGHILYETGRVKPGERIMFRAKASDLQINKEEDWIKMNFPTYSVQKAEIPDILEKAVGFKPVEFYRSDEDRTIVLAATEEEIVGAQPNFDLINKHDIGRLVIVTAKSSSSDYDFVVRCFVPKVGINEDPVTGSANVVLAPFWNMKTGKTEFKSKQVSKRTGLLKIKLVGNRVEIMGQAVTMFKLDKMEKYF
jgi:PhzF family phenazine biosynthesis protein